MAGHAQFVEDFALALHKLGLPRMPARVFSLLLSSPEPELTARELADRLEVSPAAISGAVRYLAQVHMAIRVRRPGERVDRYTVGQSFWETMMTAENAGYGTLIDRCDQALADVDFGDARERIEETRDFLAFMSAELPRIVERWKKQKRQATSSG